MLFDEPSQGADAAVPRKRQAFTGREAEMGRAVVNTTMELTHETCEALGHDSLTGDVSLRLAREEDAGDMARFYRPYVVSTAVNFEYDPPDAAEFRHRIRTVLQRFAFIVAVSRDGQVIGYTFAHPMGDRPAYAWSIGTSIYLDQAVRGRHVGSALNMS